MQSLLFILFYWSILLIPGAALDRALFRNKPRGPLAWIALSYCLFVLLFITSNYLKVSATMFGFLTFIAVVLGAVWLSISRYIKAEQILASEWKTPVLVVIAASFIYQTLFGSFNEVPADLYSHLERFQLAEKNILSNTLGTDLAWSQLLQQKSGVFYHLVALVNKLPQLDARLILELVDFSNRTFFLIAIFFFAKLIFRHQAHVTSIAYLATIFTAVHFGTGVFAFARYYSFAPTMLAMVMYFFATSLFIERIQEPFRLAPSLLNALLILSIVVSAAAVHTQEAMFIAVMAFCIALAATVSYLKRLNIAPPGARVLAAVVSIVGLSCFIAIYIYSVENLERAPNAHWRLWEFGEGFGFIPQLTTLNLKFQFIQVVTLWGLLAYGLFLLNIKRYRNNLFILAGMLSPIITFLNPFFIDVFLRHYNSTTVWRLCYILPIHFVAADLFTHYSVSLKEQTIIKKGASVLVLILFILLLAPIHNTWKNLHYSRTPTLSASKPELSYAHYDDLLNFLNSLDNSETVLTDPMLGYMISGLTKHYSARRKFFRDYRFKRFSYYDYTNKPLDRFSHHLLIVNLRSKFTSDVAELSGHWRKNEWLETENYYPEALIRHLEDRPDFFIKLWSNDDVFVYRIK